MDERDFWTGLIDEVVADAPHSLVVSDRGLSLKYQRDAVKALEALQAQHGGSLTPEIIRERPELLARELAPYFEGLAVSNYQSDRALEDAVVSMQGALGSRINGLSQQNQAGFQKLDGRLEGLGSQVTRASWLVGNTVMDSSREAASNISGVAFDHRDKRRQLDPTLLSEHGATLARLVESGYLPPSLSPGTQVAAKPESIHTLIQSGQVSPGSLQALSDASVLAPDLQAYLYKSGVVEPPVWSLAGINVGIRGLRRYSAVSHWQREQALSSHRTTNTHLAGLRVDTGQVLNATREGNRHLASMDSTLSKMQGSAQRSELYLAASAGMLFDMLGSVGEIADSLDSLTEVGRDISWGVASVDNTLRHGFSRVEEVLSCAIQAELAGAEHVAMTIREEGQRNAAFMQRLIGAVFQTTDELLSTLDLTREDLQGIRHVTESQVRAQIDTIAELRALRHERAEASMAVISLTQEQNALLGTIHEGILLPESEKEVRACLQRAERAVKAQRPAVALSHLEKALTFDDTNADVHFQVGQVLIQERKYDEAEAHFRDAADFADTAARKAKALLFLGLCMLRKTPSEGLNILDESEVVAPDAQVSLLKARVQWQLGKKKEAYASLSRAIKVDGRVILELIHDPAYEPMREGLWENVLTPLVQSGQVLNSQALYFITFVINQIESEDFPPRELKLALREHWKHHIKLALTKDPSALVTNVFLSGVMTKMSRNLVSECILEVLEAGIPQYPSPSDYYFVSSLLFSSVQHERVVRQLLWEGLEQDSRAEDPSKFKELTEEILRIGGEGGAKILDLISKTGGSKHRHIKDYMYEITHGH